MAGESATAVYLLRHGRTGARRAGRLLAGLRGDAPPVLVLSSPRVRALRTAELAGLSVTASPRTWPSGTTATTRA